MHLHTSFFPERDSMILSYSHLILVHITSRVSRSDNDFKSCLGYCKKLLVKLYNRTYPTYLCSSKNLPKGGNRQLAA